MCQLEEMQLASLLCSERQSDSFFTRCIIGSFPLSNMFLLKVDSCVLHQFNRVLTTYIVVILQEIYSLFTYS